MYTKLFASILDSTIWMESIGTRIVWITFLAAMDEDGYVSLSSVANVAHRARVSLSEASDAVDRLESPDPHSKDTEHEGRRIERIDGGFIVLNAKKYRELSRRNDERAKTRLRVAAFKARKKESGNAKLTVGNAKETERNGKLTPKLLYTDTYTNTDKEHMSGNPRPSRDIFDFWRVELLHPSAKFLKKRERLIEERLKEYSVDVIKSAIRGIKMSPHHMGKNDADMIYDDISLICRDGTFIEKFSKLDQGKKKKAVKSSCSVKGCVDLSSLVRSGSGYLCGNHYYEKVASSK